MFEGDADGDADGLEGDADGDADGLADGADAVGDASRCLSSRKVDEVQSMGGDNKAVVSDSHLLKKHSHPRAVHSVVNERSPCERKPELQVTVRSSLTMQVGLEEEA